MKNIKIITGVLFVFLLIANGLKAQALTGGLNRNGFIGSGDCGNYFDFANGYFLEFDLDPLVWGISRSSHKNYVKNSVAEATFSTLYVEFRDYKYKQKYQFFWFWGFDWNFMHFENTEGSDNQCLCSIGIGARIPIGKTLFIQPKVKPYYIIGNSLGQKWGIALQLAIGWE